MVPAGESVIAFAGELAESMLSCRLTGRIAPEMSAFAGAIAAGAAALPELSSARLVGRVAVAAGLAVEATGVGKAGLGSSANAGIAIDQQVAGADLALVAAALAA